MKLWRLGHTTPLRTPSVAAETMQQPHATLMDEPFRATEDPTEEKTDASLDEVPDRGWRAWMVVFGSWCCTFLISGWINALGVFQDYYSTVLFPELSTSTVSLIPSLVQFLIFAGVSAPAFPRPMSVAHSVKANLGLALRGRALCLAACTTSMARDSFSLREPLCMCSAWSQPHLPTSISTPSCYPKASVSAPAPSSSWIVGSPRLCEGLKPAMALPTTIDSWWECTSRLRHRRKYDAVSGNIHHLHLVFKAARPGSRVDINW